MSLEEEFDRIIQRKTEEADFPFDESNWEKARGMLDATRKTKRVGFLPGVAAVVVIGLGLGAAAWWYLLPTSPLAEATTQGPAPAHSNGAVAATAPAPVAPVNRTPASPSAQTGSRPTLGTPASNRSAAARTSAQTHQPAASRQAPALSTTAAPAGEEEVQLHAEQGLQPAETTQNSRTLAETSADAGDPSLAMPAATAAEQPMHHAVAVPERLFVESLPHTLPPAAPLATPDVTLAALNWLSYFDDDYYKPEKYKKHYLNLEAGASYLYGWEVAGTYDGRGFNWFGGFNYGMYIHRKADVSIGLQAYNIGNMSQAFFDVSKTEFGFSSVTTRTTIAVNALYYLAVPVKFTWQINATASFGLGCNLGLLMDSRNTMRTTIKSEQGTRETTTATKGYYNEGMNPTHIQLSGFYKTRVSDRFALHAELMWAPLDIFKYANSKVNTANMVGLRVGVNYTLFDK